MAFTEWSEYYYLSVELPFSERFLYYSDYYAYIARAGRECASSLFETISTAQRIDITTFNVFEDALSARDNLNFSLQTSYETVFSNVYQTSSMQVAFDALAKYVVKTEGYPSVNDLLTTLGIRVLPAYASLSNIFGQTIDTGNIRDYGESS